jgi:hypothetical protein
MRMAAKNIFEFLLSLFGTMYCVSCVKEKSCEGCISGNKPPTSIAGPDQAIGLPIDSILLDGSASTDPDGTITSYLWKKISGPASLTINSATSAKTYVRNLAAGTYQFELEVVDDGGLTDKDTMQLVVNPETIDIYVAGQENSVPVYWKNGQAISLDNLPSGFSGTAIAVVGNDIYVAGTRTELYWDGNRAKYWINGQEAPLGIYAGATSIAVAGSDIYVAGYEWESSNYSSVAKYWKNGQAVMMTDGTNNAWANSIAIIGNDIYVAGHEGVFAKYWKNGQAVVLTDGTNSAEASCIVLSGGDVYVAGHEGSVARYWKNGLPFTLGEGIATSIVVVGSDVYVAGYTFRAQGNSVAKYWKNGQEVTLTNGSEAYGMSIAVLDGDVYVAGTEVNNFNYVAKYWKNGQPVPLTTGSNQSQASGIVVVRR